MSTPLTEMRLPDFILANTGSILAEWDAFARSIWPCSDACPEDVRDHAEAILRETAWDMKSPQTAREQSDKSKGLRESDAMGGRLNRASSDHAVGRAASGFDLRAVIAEYRALRASVVRLWIESRADPDANDLADITRFNESMDQSLGEAVQRYSDHLDKSRQMFLRVLGHDLRSPLNAIAVLAQDLAESRQGDSETLEITSQIRSSADVVGRMLNDFLDFAVTRLGRPMPVVPARMDLSALCREVIAEVRTSCSGCAWHLDIDPELEGEWDRARLRQLLSNLLNNAVQHGGQASSIKIVATRPDSHVRIAVHNDGSSIPDVVLPRIFEPFVRGPNADASRGSVGLGLYIAREVALAHGGTIEVASSPALGTTFTVTLPLSIPIPQTHRPRLADEAPECKRSV